jgi:hypothetical protein
MSKLDTLQVRNDLNYMTTKFHNRTRVVLTKEPCGKCDSENRIPYGMYPPSLRSNRRFMVRVNLKFCQSYQVKSGEKTAGHVTRSPRALS